MCQHHAVGINHFAAYGRRGNQRNAVGGGFGGEFFMLDYLQKHKAANQNGEKHHNQHKRHHQAQQIIALLNGLVGGGLMILAWRFHQRKRRELSMPSIILLKSGHKSAPTKGAIKPAQPEKRWSYIKRISIKISWLHNKAPSTATA